MLPLYRSDLRSEFSPEERSGNIAKESVIMVAKPNIFPPLYVFGPKRVV